MNCTYFFYYSALKLGYIRERVSSVVSLLTTATTESGVTSSRKGGLSWGFCFTTLIRGSTVNESRGSSWLSRRANDGRGKRRRYNRSHRGLIRWNPSWAASRYTCWFASGSDSWFEGRLASRTSGWLEGRLACGCF